jgi:transcriptional regulator with XRE-family HTH domain
MTTKERIKEALKEERYNFSHLADHMGVDNGHLSSVLNGKRKASKAYVFLLTATLNDMTKQEFTTQDFKDLHK